MRNGQYFVHSTHEIQMLLPPALFCHKPHTFLTFAVSLWSQGLLPCKERINYGRHYVIKTQRKPRNDPTELVVFRPSAVILRAGVSNIVTTSSQSE